MTKETLYILNKILKSLYNKLPTYCICADGKIWNKPNVVVFCMQKKASILDQIKLHQAKTVPTQPGQYDYHQKKACPPWVCYLLQVRCTINCSSLEDLDVAVNNKSLS